MSKNLIIIESPGKIKSYQKYLGSDYKIMASYGHVIDLPPKELGVDIKDQFKPSYEVMKDKKDVVSSIVKEAKDADIVYLMSDPDREGTAIAWHISKQFPASVKYKRAVTSSITKQAILEAIKNASEIDMKMVDSYEARRILDRLVGFKTSFLVKMKTGGPSAGRVQSAALRILADREVEIRDFVPVEYWPIAAELETMNGSKFWANVTVPDKMETNSEALANKVIEKVKQNKIAVKTYEVKNVQRSPFPPFTTSTLQGSASSLFKWDQKKTMQVAQSLYESGHITYMRTDSNLIVPEKIAEIRAIVEKNFGIKYIPQSPHQYKSGKNAQEAHEAIRPTDFSLSNVETGDESRLYNLIWKRAVASQMAQAQFEQIKATFEAGDVVLSANGSKLLFDGWKKVWNFTDSEDVILPNMKIGDKLKLVDIQTEQKFTEPPPRYGVSSFNTKLEDLGIARPSTLATVTKTLQDRGYIETKKNVHHVTDLGIRVTEFLTKNNFCFSDINFTKKMEDDLDEILENKKNKLQVLDDFWKTLKEDIKRASDSKTEVEKTEHACPVCKSNKLEKFLVKRKSRFGEFYSCENYKKCGYKADIGEEGKPIDKVKKEPPKDSGFKCPKCGKSFVERNGKFGKFLGCSGYPKCMTTADLNGNVKVKSKK